MFAACSFLSVLLRLQADFSHASMNHIRVFAAFDRVSRVSCGRFSSLATLYAFLLDMSGIGAEEAAGTGLAVSLATSKGFKKCRQTRKVVAPVP